MSKGKAQHSERLGPGGEGMATGPSFSYRLFFLGLRNSDDSRRGERADVPGEIGRWRGHYIPQVGLFLSFDSRVLIHRSTKYWMISHDDDSMAGYGVYMRFLLRLVKLCWKELVFEDRMRYDLLSSFMAYLEPPSKQAPRPTNS